MSTIANLGWGWSWTEDRRPIQPGFARLFQVGAQNPINLIKSQNTKLTLLKIWPATVDFKASREKMWQHSSVMLYNYSHCRDVKSRLRTCAALGWNPHPNILFPPPQVLSFLTRTPILTLLAGGDLVLSQPFSLNKPYMICRTISTTIFCYF